MIKSELDTSGDVGPMPAGSMNERFLKWNELDAFTQGYIEAMFAAEAEALNKGRIGARLPLRRVAFRDLASETLARIISDCEGYQSFAASSNLLAMCGKNFWKWRNEGRYGDRFSPLNAQLGDDGKVRFAA